MKTQQNFCNKLRAALREKSEALSSYIKKSESTHINGLIAQLKYLEKQE